MPFVGWLVGGKTPPGHKFHGEIQRKVPKAAAGDGVGTQKGGFGAGKTCGKWGFSSQTQIPASSPRSHR